jgi:glycosyltransferase involved in cell wall biosynthesis
MIVISFVLIIHALVVGMWTRGFKQQHQVRDNLLEPLTVIIACKNEEHTLPFLLSSLKDQTTQPFEIIVIDDHSTDLTKEIASKFTVLNNNGVGKKDAIRTGIKHCKTKWAITTDADVQVPATWINSMSSAAGSTSGSALIGPVKITPHASAIVSGVERLDYAALMGWSASTAVNGNAAMGSAANFAIKVSDYPNEDQIKSKVESGDDVFAIHSLVSLGKKVFWVHDLKACVEAGSAGSISNWIRQRARWGAKAKHYTNPKAVKTSYWIATIGLIQLTTIGLLIADFKSSILAFGVLWLGRAAIDIIFTRKVAAWFQICTPTLSWVLLAVTYPFQIPTVFIYSFFFKAKWR